MHHRNPYKRPLDFDALAKSYPPLVPFLIKPKLAIDFKNAAAQRRLTEALLYRDFQLKLSLPDDRLCPPVPNRLNYLLWIQDVIRETLYTLDTVGEIIGLDVGTGASAIYPLLGCRLEPSWKFLVTEIDSTSYSFACSNIASNDLEHRVQVNKVTQNDPLLLPLFENPAKNFAFTMCNPPFYSSVEDIEKSADEKNFEPTSVCTGSEIEMITMGGEEHFVKRMVEESFKPSIRDRCLWFTSMFGKLSSLASIIGYLRDLGVGNYIVTELVQGQTRRWVIGWSYGDVHVSDDVARNMPWVHHALFPLPNTLKQTFSGPRTLTSGTLKDLLIRVVSSLKGASTKVLTALSEENGNNMDVPYSVTIRVFAATNTWSRAARRKNQMDTNLSDITGAAPALVVDIKIMGNKSESILESSWILECTWRLGKDRKLFESFWSHVNRKVLAEVLIMR